MAVELEALRFGGGLEPIEMEIEVGDPLVGIELHRLFEVAHLPFITGGGAKDKTLVIAKPRGCS
jgi:hypothetical protein